MILEICTASAEDSFLAQTHGARRIELNSALEVGGLTPSLGLIEATLRRVSIPVIVMIRPRPGGFGYSEAEFDIMRRDAEAALKLGAAGIAFGILTQKGQIDEPRCRELIQLCRDKEAVFHRAFDWLSDLEAGLESLIKMGFTRVLTSGGAPTALQGADAIRSLIQQSRNRIQILPGAGIRQDNVKALLERTGCSQIHGTFSKEVMDESGRGVSVSFGGDSHPAAYKSLDIEQLSL